MPGPQMVTTGGVDLAVYSDRVGEAGRNVLCLHETGATAASWRPLTEALAGRGDFTTLRYDRRGWGASEAPEPYTRTTVAEQAQDALGLLDAHDFARATLCGSGLGAISALDLALREPSRVEAVFAVEPPLLALAEGATEGLSHDIEALREAAEAASETDSASGREAAAELFLAGSLPYLAPGSGRITAREAAGAGDGFEARRRPASLLAELGAVPAWPLPFAELEATEIPIVLVIGAATPQPVRLAASGISNHAPSADLVDLAQEDPLHGSELARLLDAAAI